MTRPINALNEADIMSYGDYAFDMINRGIISAWDTGINKSGEPWALMLDGEDRVVWGVIRTRGWYVLMDYKSDAVSVSRHLTEALTALP